MVPINKTLLWASVFVVKKNIYKKYKKTLATDLSIGPVTVCARKKTSSGQSQGIGTGLKNIYWPVK